MDEGRIFTLSCYNFKIQQQNLTNYADVESVWIDGMIEIVEKLKYNYVVWEEVFRQVLSESLIIYAC